MGKIKKKTGTKLVRDIVLFRGLSQKTGDEWLRKRNLGFLLAILDALDKKKIFTLLELTHGSLVVLPIA
jgi:hypothetical protein